MARRSTVQKRVSAMRMQSIFIKGLFGRFDHKIRMNLEDRITIIHGPNGFGKTAILRLIANLFSASNATTLFSIPYTQLEVEFERGDKISVTRLAKVKDGRSETGAVRFLYHNHSKANEFILPKRRPEQQLSLEMVDRFIPELERQGVELWRHLETGETFSLDDVLERFGDRIPFSAERTEIPDWLKTIRQSIPIRFIQAERLQTLPRAARALRHPHAKVPHNRAVKLYSEELGSIIKQTLTEYATLSQSLDRTFPMRVVSHGQVLPIEKLQSALKETESKRSRLVEAGLLEQEGQDAAVPILQHVDQANLPVLSVYVQDAQKKLGVFDPLVAKVELFKRSINNRFLYKQVSVSKEGFRFRTVEGDRLDPGALSSGEQHEVVLLYQLLFEARENSLILLDEPEISLHVAWQEQFLADLREIAALSGFDALIATHSPQIISDRWDLTVELKGPANEVPAHTPSTS
jgi:predicted ATP-binding protein involved in virulence